MNQAKIRNQFIHLWSIQLNRDYDRINWAYRLKLVKPPIVVVETSSYWGQWDPLNRELKISANVISNHPWPVVIEILKHEIAHQLTTDRLGLDDGHGPHFQKFCELLGLDPRFRRSKVGLDLTEIQIGASLLQHSQPSMDAEDRLLAKVARLLSLAQSSEEHEALRAMEKVSEHYERYNLERLQNRLKSRHSFVIIPLNSKKVSTTTALICSILGEHFFVEPILSDQYCAKANEHFKTIEIYGEEANLKMAEYVFYFLKNQCDQLWENALKKGLFKKTHRRSFQLGLLHGFNKKLDLSRKQRHKGPHSSFVSKNLVALEEDIELFGFIKSKHPRLQRRQRKTHRIDHHAYSQGEREGHQLVLRGGIENRSESSSSGSRFLPWKQP